MIETILYTLFSYNAFILLSCFYVIGKIDKKTNSKTEKDGKMVTIVLQIVGILVCLNSAINDTRLYIEQKEILNQMNREENL